VASSAGRTRQKLTEDCCFHVGVAGGVESLADRGVGVVFAGCHLAAVGGAGGLLGDLAGDVAGGVDLYEVAGLHVGDCEGRLLEGRGHDAADRHHH